MSSVDRSFIFSTVTLNNFIKEIMNTSAHKWRFFRSGGFDEVRLETGEDIKLLTELDPKLWAALSCPTTSLEFDQKTLEFLDSDKDGHIRVEK